MREGGYGDERFRIGTIMPISGRVDGSTVSQLRDQLHSAVDGGIGVMVLDLSEVELIDAVGLAMLVGTRRRALRAGRDVLLRGTPARVARMLAATGLARELRSETPVPVA
jgi:anti-sigma B factor antagonist